MLIKHRVVTIALIVLAAATMFIGLKMFMAGIFSWQTGLFLETWQTKQIPPAEQQWQTAQQATLNTQAWSPVQQAHYLAQQGRVYEWHNFQLDWNDTDAKASRLAAIQTFRQQTQLTPTWPYAWLNLVAAKAQLKQIDEEFEHAFNQVEKTGQQNARVILALAEFGNRSWEHLPTKYKSQTIQTIVFSASQSPQNANKLKKEIYNPKILYMTCWFANTKGINTFSLCESS